MWPILTSPLYYDLIFSLSSDSQLAGNNCLYDCKLVASFLHGLPRFFLLFGLCSVYQYFEAEERKKWERPGNTYHMNDVMWIGVPRPSLFFALFHFSHTCRYLSMRTAFVIVTYPELIPYILFVTHLLELVYENNLVSHLTKLSKPIKQKYLY